jgi:hypothetical protein
MANTRDGAADGESAAAGEGRVRRLVFSQLVRLPRAVRHSLCVFARARHAISWERAPFCARVCRAVMDRRCLCEQPPQVGIVGGGIGGLALAIALRNKGIDCVVFERDKSFGERSQGYGLTMQQGAKTLKKLGVQLSGISSSIHLSLRPDGELLGAYGREWREDQVGSRSAPAHSTRTRTRTRASVTARARLRAGGRRRRPGGRNVLEVSRVHLEAPKDQGPQGRPGAHQVHRLRWIW